MRVTHIYSVGKIDEDSWEVTRNLGVTQRVCPQGAGLIALACVIKERLFTPLRWHVIEFLVFLP